MVPTEILCHIFSFLSYAELYRIRSVSHEWKQQSEYTIYLIFKRSQQKLSVQIGKQASVVDLVPVNYDPDHQVIEFHTPCSNAEPDEYDFYITEKDLRAKVIFSEWRERTMANAEIIQNLDLAEKAQVLFHLTFNPCLEQLYEFPPLTSITDTKTRYIGARGIIIAFEYHNEIPSVSDFQGLDDEPPSPFDNNDNRITKRIRIKSIHTNLSWLLSGINPDVVIQQIYNTKYQRLINQLAAKGLKPSTLYSDDIFRYIIEEESGDILRFSQSEKEESVQSLRLNDLQNKLQENGVDPRVVWKYTFAKNFIYRPMYSNMRLEDVAEKLLMSERKWVLQKIDLLRKVNKGEA